MENALMQLPDNVDIDLALEASENEEANLESLSASVESILKLDQGDGTKDPSTSGWVYGSDRKQVPLESLWMVDPSSLQKGYMGWEKINDGKMPDRYMVPWYQAWPEKPESPPWLKKAYEVRLACVFSPDKADVGAYVQFGSNADHGVRALAAIELEIRRRWKSGKPEAREKIFPVIELNHSSYYNKNYRKWIRKSELRIVKWTDCAASDFAISKEQIEAHSADEPEPEVVDGAPRRRKRNEG